MTLRKFGVMALYAALMHLGVETAIADAVRVPDGTVVQAPAWTPGSEWHYSDGYGLKVSSSSPGGTVFERVDAPGQWFSRLGFIRTDSLTAGVARNAIYRTVPNTAGFALSAGKPLTFQREYLSNGKLFVHASSWTVEGRETITVPAGTFDCWIIVWRTRSLRSDWTGFERWWYSPQAQHYVRLEYQYGHDSAGSRVLMRYNPVAALSPSALLEGVEPNGSTVQEETFPRPASNAGDQASLNPVAALRSAELLLANAPTAASDSSSQEQVGSSEQRALLRTALKNVARKNAKLAALHRACERMAAQRTRATSRFAGSNPQCPVSDSTFPAP